MEAHSGAWPHPGAVEAHSGAVKPQLGREEDLPGAMKAYPEGV
jgi:hypothetical protein